MHPERVEAGRIEEILVGEKWIKRAKAEGFINVHCGAALTFCPDTHEEALKKSILSILSILKPRSATSLEGEELVEVENANADRVRSLKALIECFQAVDETNEVTHAYKHFPLILASYDDGKDEADLKIQEGQLVREQRDLNELDTKIARAMAEKNTEEEKHYSGKRRGAVKDLESVKAKIVALQERIGRKVARLTQNRSRQFTPTRLGKRGSPTSFEESPEKKLRTDKQFPLNSPDDVSYNLDDFFKGANTDLTFKCGESGGFEQDAGEWSDDAQRKLTFLQEEVKA